MRRHRVMALWVLCIGLAWHASAQAAPTGEGQPNSLTQERQAGGTATGLSERALLALMAYNVLSPDLGTAMRLTWQPWLDAGANALERPAATARLVPLTELTAPGVAAAVSNGRIPTEVRRFAVGPVAAWNALTNRLGRGEARRLLNAPGRSAAELSAAAGTNRIERSGQ